MQQEELMLDDTTFLSLLSVCNHLGVVKEGREHFASMWKAFDIIPDIELYNCMIDLFGRAGRFDRVKTLLNRVPHSSHLPLLQSILSSCNKWRNVKLGRWAFEQLVRLDEKCAAAYVCMENIYASAGMQIEAREIDFLRAKNKDVI